MYPTARIAVNATAVATSDAQRGGPSRVGHVSAITDQLHNRGVNHTDYHS